MITPILTPVRSERAVTNVFRGYNHNLQIGDGEWYDTYNLSSSHAPLFSPRAKRGEVRTMLNPGGLIEKDGLYYVDNGTLYVNGRATSLTGLAPGEKALTSFGAYIIIMPDKVWYNTALDADDEQVWGTIDAHKTWTGDISYVMCHVDGRPYENVYKGETEPTESSFEIWIETTPGVSSIVIKQKTGEGWVELNTVYTKIIFPTQGQISGLFSEMDAVEISGSGHEGINGSHMIYAVGGRAAMGDEPGENDYIVVIHQLNTGRDDRIDESITIDRNMPDMDFMCESNNRLWGCFYGFNPTTGQTLNEIYCCALGDFKNWSRFAGVSTDSWVGSVGSDGEWTGAINYLGAPTFFKENHIHVVGISPYGAHQIRETPCRGVQKGSHKSLAIVNETLYYKSRTDICAYQGSFPNGISDALGNQIYYDGVAGVFGEKYYLSMRDGSGAYSLFVYDVSNRMWMKEDDLHVIQFCKVDDELYALTANNKLLALNGTTGARELQINWSCETGMQHYNEPNNKYLSRYDIRIKGERGAKIEIYMDYDSSETWQHAATINQSRTDTVVVPIRPRRCDHLRMRLVGTGDVKIYSIARVLEVGSDV